MGFRLFPTLWICHKHLEQFGAELLGAADGIAVLSYVGTCAHNHSLGGSGHNDGFLSAIFRYLPVKRSKVEC